jgi:hypothetical protein
MKEHGSRWLWPGRIIAGERYPTKTRVSRLTMYGIGCPTKESIIGSTLA